MSMRVAYVIGTRPEVIRSARLLYLMGEDPDFDVRLVNTGQHYDHEMMGVFLSELKLPGPDVDLEVGSGEDFNQTALTLERSGDYFTTSRPGLVCVYGDTNSSLAAGLAAVKSGVPLVHIEAGCRSFDMTMPEEINRRVLDHVSGLLLAVSNVGRQNLRDEAVLGTVSVVGDPQFDVFCRRGVAGRTKRDEIGLVTLHRPENADHPERLAHVLDRLNSAAVANRMEWVFPVHPRTRKTLPAILPPAVRLTDPLPYDQMLDLLARARICLTDSGGLQKEALWMRTPCVTLRRTTEWLETIWQGANVLADADGDLDDVVTATLAKKGVDFSNPYGNGHASEAIVNSIRNWTRKGNAQNEMSTE